MPPTPSAVCCYSRSSLNAFGGGCGARRGALGCHHEPCRLLCWQRRSRSLSMLVGVPSATNAADTASGMIMAPKGAPLAPPCITRTAGPHGTAASATLVLPLTLVRGCVCCCLRRQQQTDQARASRA